MKIWDNIKISFTNLRKRKLRTFLTSFAIAIGTMLIVSMVGLGVGLKDMVIKEIKQQTSVTQIYVMPYRQMQPVNVNLTEEDLKKAEEEKANSYKKITEEDILKIKGIAEVDDIQSVISTRITYTQLNGKKSYANKGMGFDLNYSVFTKAEIEKVRVEKNDNSIQPIIAGRNLQKGDINAVVVGEKYLKAMGFNDYNAVLGQEIVINCEISQFPGAPAVTPFTGKAVIVGVVSEEFSDYADSIIMPIEMAAAIQGYYNSNPSYYKEKGPDNLVVQAKSLDDVKKIADEISKMDFTVQTYQSVVDEVNKMFNIFEGLLAVGGLVVLFVASLGVINTMIMAIYERTRSIGIMKAIGASKNTIRRIFLMESGTLGFVGGVIGVILGWMTTKLLGFALNQYLKSQGNSAVDIFSMPIWLTLGGLAFAILISVIAGLYPAARASKLDPIEALRYE